MLLSNSSGKVKLREKEDFPDWKELPCFCADAMEQKGAEWTVDVGTIPAHSHATCCCHHGRSVFSHTCEDAFYVY